VNSESYVAYHGYAHLKGCMDSHKSGLVLQVRLTHEEDYKSFKEFRKHKKGKAGTGLYNCFTRPEDAENWYGPVQLKFIRWAISSANGAIVTFEMDDKTEWQRMRDAPAIDSGYEMHQLTKMEFMLVELDEEGKAVNVEQKAKLEKLALKRQWPKGGPQSIRAARLCNNLDFINWLGERGILDASRATPADVADWMRKECDIDSRAQLDHDPAALIRFEEKIHKPFIRTFVD